MTPGSIAKIILRRAMDLNPYIAAASLALTVAQFGHEVYSWYSDVQYDRNFRR